MKYKYCKTFIKFEGIRGPYLLRGKDIDYVGRAKNTTDYETVISTDSCDDNEDEHFPCTEPLEVVIERIQDWSYKYG